MLTRSPTQHLVSEASIHEQKQEAKSPTGYFPGKAKWPGGLGGENLDFRRPEATRLTGHSKAGPWEQHFIEGHLSSFEAACISCHRHALRPMSP